MKKIAILCILCTALTIVPTQKTHAFYWVIVKAVLKKVIKAIDLQVQRLQNKTIWLQNAQKTLENTMSKLQLDEISDWVSKHKEQYVQYFDELHKVKEAISAYQQVRSIMDKQLQIVNEYKHALNLFKQDTHFTSSEVEYMLQVYEGIINESLKNMDQLFLVINSLTTEMTDGKRLAIIQHVAHSIDDNLNDLRLFNQQNIRLSLQRSKDADEVKQVRAMYGLQ
ncbi:conjugal transfer protein TraI [Pinibacter aurantiacus]|uniref:Conjugal transfer protein TraI n=1 Tax=Pinibacter aurantiacus TaxID=2851599 RepID=A0A9E2SAX2_9BACT|nr:conjugal transfer protein TraI [Pinibacter aurantiacus]MBV4358797.1 conjugal transfer protein TraI [Pinibacter aurantiacus]